MEKLQAALEKARKTRGGDVVVPGSRSVPVASMERAEGRVDALWQALPAFEVNADHLEAHRVVTRVASAKATPFDILRTKVLLQMRQNGWKRLAITSPMPKSGKSTAACNLALGLGRQRDMRAMLFDLDLRDPSVGVFFEFNPPHGINELLSGTVSFAEQGVRLGDNVAISMAKERTIDPTRVLLAEETAEALSQVEADYDPDLMIFDLPSMLVNDDTRAFLKNVDCALIVARADTTLYGQLDTCEREISEQTNVLGVVLNAYRHSDPGKSDE